MKRSETPCSVLTCERLSIHRGWCAAHYSRWVSTGDIRAHVPVLARDASTSERFWAKVLKLSDCWLWVGSLGSSGYGQFKGKPAHRFAYTEMRGPIPDGLVLDHLCREEVCVNPWHLEPVTVHENTMRGFGPAPDLRRRSACKNGHPLEGDNLRIRPDGSRKCLACHREWQRAYVKRKALSDA